MVHSLDPKNKRYLVKDSFEIEARNAAGHAPGLVVVLDRRVDESDLESMNASIHLPSGDVCSITIDEVKDHLVATSLFFKGKTITDIPKESQIEITKANGGTALS